MSTVTTTSADKAQIIYEIFKRKMAKYGRHVSVPKNGDLQKTYNWRYIVNFVKVLEANDLMEQAPEVIEAIVQDAKKRGTIRRNFTILNIRGKVLEIYEKKLEADLQTVSRQIAAVRRAHDFFVCKVGDQNPIEVLLCRPSMGYTNLARWYDAGYLSAFYIAVSKSCRTAIDKLSKSDRSLFPTNLQLYKLLFVAARDKTLAPKLKAILGPEYAG